MPTQRGGYYLKDGTRIPSVTTIISRFKDSAGLIYWAWKEGSQGRDYRQTRDAAADAGTLAHSRVEHWLHDQDFIEPSTTDEILLKSQTSFSAFLEWAGQTQLHVTQTETPLISERYRYGGTFDAVTLNARRAMADWKTANAVYADNLIQLAAYGLLWEENHPDDPITGGYHLLRFDKTYGDFKHHWWSELESAKSAFLHLRDLYELDKELRARAK